MWKVNKVLHLPSGWVRFSRLENMPENYAVDPIEAIEQSGIDVPYSIDEFCRRVYHIQTEMWNMILHWNKCGGYGGMTLEEYLRILYGANNDVS